MKKSNKPDTEDRKPNTKSGEREKSAIMWDI